MERTEYLILGAGVAGLAAAKVLGPHAVVLEQEDRPGGLVRSDYLDGYWFDHVLHVLYFADAQTEARVRELMGDDLAPCPSEAWVETAAGTVRFPLQMHLRGLDLETVVRCVYDLAKTTFRTYRAPPANFEEMLLQTFGRSLCETFLLPYNRKMWKRPLQTLAPSGFTWNITQPDLQDVLRGALSAETEFRAYNATGWYPRPRPGAPRRGMEVLSRALAQEAYDLRLDHAVESIDLAHRVVTARHDGRRYRFCFHKDCLSTLPLPLAIELCRQAPPRLRRACKRLSYNRVLSAAFCLRGPRPAGRGHWRYYADESISFTRLIYMHEFDPLSAPADGWGLLAEITEPAEVEPQDPEEVLSRAEADIRRVGALPEDCEIIDAQLRIVDPAYVAFTVDNQPIIEAARRFLRDHGITPLGRYGRWEYSSMGQVMRDAFAWAEDCLAQQRPARLVRPSLVE